MNLEVIAEGIETAQQLDLVRAFGCDLGQGFLISRPLPEPEFLAWCEANRSPARKYLAASAG
ncbi:MAG: EAL domain-containing protein, partial [Woeseiaceae bacterium]